MRRVLVPLLCTGLGVLAGVLLALSEIGWTVMAANGVRDLSIQQMQLQGEALQQCRADAAIPPKATNRTPRRFQL